MSGKISSEQKSHGSSLHYQPGQRLRRPSLRFGPAGDSDRPLRLRVLYGRKGTFRPVKTARNIRCGKGLYGDSLYFVQGDILLPAVVELGCPGRFVVGDVLGRFQGAVVLEVGGNAGGAEGVLVQTAKGLGDNGIGRIAKLNGILYLPDVGSKTTSFSSAFAGLFASN